MAAAEPPSSIRRWMAGYPVFQQSNRIDVLSSHFLSAPRFDFIKS